MRVTLIVALIAMSHVLFAQSDEDKILGVINQLFEGMRAGDSTMVRDVFHVEASLKTVIEKGGQPILRNGSVDRFATAVGTPHDDVWDEPIWDTEIRIDGNLAQVWTKYALFVGDKFSHCGVDTFLLFKSEKGWKIFQLTDTRQYTDCEMPPNR
ncbi:MAG: nuclear transport factor 2 family protein [Cyclobacteriaceae bacterium]